MVKGLGILVFALLFLVASNFIASAYVKEEINKNYVNNYDTWTYREDKHHRTFTLTHTWSSPTYTYTAASRDSNLVNWKNNQLESDSPPANSYAALNAALNTFNSRRSYSYSSFGFGWGWGYKDNCWGC